MSINNQLIILEQEKNEGNIPLGYITHLAVRKMHPALRFLNEYSITL